jgi:acetyl esterase/lipase
MSNSTWFSTILSLALVTGFAYSQTTRPAYPPQMDGAVTEVYKRASDSELKMYIFNPPGHRAGDKRPAIVFFFGGGWQSGTPQQFEQHCRYLASRGMVAMTADYRVRSRQGVNIEQCIGDAKSAVRWIRQNAQRLGIDPDRIAAGGGSAGGHLAAATAFIRDFDDGSEHKEISSHPNALILFNPALVLAAADGLGPNDFPDVTNRVGVELDRVSPFHHILKGAPATIIFHGAADKTVPFVTAELFAKKMKADGNRCELVSYEGETHGFFNYGRGGNKAYLATLRRADEFLVSLGYLKGAAMLP